MSKITGNQLVKDLEEAMVKLGKSLEYTATDGFIIIACSEKMPYFQYNILINKIHDSGKIFSIQYKEESFDIVFDAK